MPLYFSHIKFIDNLAILLKKKAYFADIFLLTTLQTKLTNLCFIEILMIFHPVFVYN